MTVSFLNYCPSLLTDEYSMSMFVFCISKYMFYTGVHIRKNKWQLTKD